MTIETTWTPSLVAVREGADGPWQTLPHGSTASTFSYDAHGPYMITVVCDDGVGDITTWQVARTPDDPRSLAKEYDVGIFARTATTPRSPARPPT